MFPTEREVYHRLRWDARFDVNRCHVVISLRPEGTKRIAFLDFDAERVPWHRIVEFWIDGALAWSRAQRIDRLDELARAADAAAPPAGIERLEPHGAPPARPPPTALRVVTWNLLFDLYEPELLRSPERWQDALDRLGALDADVIALVEVTPAIWERVLAQPWVRGYAASHGPAPRGLTPYGQALLARTPIREVGLLSLVRGRRALVATLDLGDRAVGVAAVHLTSDRKDGAAAIRRAQLDTIVAHIRATPRDAWIVAGDFNESPTAVGDTVDAWAAVHPDDPGCTFDPARNSLAAAITVSGMSRRIDRIHVTGLAPTGARLVGIEPGPSGLPPSDHYAVCVELAVPPPAAIDLRGAPTTPRTALVLVPPVDAWGPIQRIRCAMDRGFGRWLPHITLAYPFVDDARAPQLLRRLAATVEPFDIELEDIAPIDNAGHTIVLLPDRASTRALERLRAALAPALPASERAYRPHLTIARDVDPRTIEPIRVAWRVDRLAILRDRERIMVVDDEIPLGKASGSRTRSTSAPTGASTGAATATRAGASIGASTDASMDASMDTSTDASTDASTPGPVIDRVRGVVAAIDPAATIEPYGSIVYAPDHARDIDLMIASDAAELAGGIAAALQMVEAGAANKLRGTIEGRTVEIAIVSRSTPDLRIAAGPRDARYLVTHLVEHGQYGAFLAAWPEVQRFVQLRALHGNGLGFMGSFGWALLLAIPLCHDERLCASREVVGDWLAWLAGVAPGTRVGFDAVPAPDRSPLWIAAPTPPPSNAARGLTAGTFAIVRDEARRAARDGHRDMRDIADDPPPGACLAFTGDAAARGNYHGLFRSLLGDLEAALGPTVRPWGRFDRDGERWIHRIGVPVERVADARTIATTWVDSLAGANTQVRLL